MSSFWDDINPVKQIQNLFDSSGNSVANLVRPISRVVDPVGAFGGNNVFGSTGLRDGTVHTLSQGANDLSHVNPLKVLDPTGSFGGSNIVGGPGLRDVSRNDVVGNKNPVATIADPLGFFGDHEAALYKQDNNTLGFSGDDLAHWRNGSMVGGYATAAFFGGEALFGGEAAAGAGVGAEAGAGAEAGFGASTVGTELGADTVLLDAGGEAAFDVGAANEAGMVAEAGSAAAAGGTSAAGYAAYAGDGLMAYGLLSGKKSAGDALSYFGGDSVGADPGSGDWWNAIGDLVNGPGTGSRGGTSYVTDPGSAVSAPKAQGVSMVMIAALAVGGYFLYKKVA